MKREMQTKRNMAVLLTGMVLLAGGLAPIASAKKPTPEQPQEARYTLVELVGLGGMGRSADINDAGHIVFNRLVKAASVLLMCRRLSIMIWICRMGVRHLDFKLHDILVLIS